MDNRLACYILLDFTYFNIGCNLQIPFFKNILNKNERCADINSKLLIATHNIYPHRMYHGNENNRYR